jgi:hypothetical protein
LLGDTLHVKGSQQYLLIIRGLGRPKKLLAAVQPWQRILGAVILGKTQFVGSSVEQCAGHAPSLRRVPIRLLSFRGNARLAGRGFLVQLLGLDVVDGDMELSLIDLERGNLV